MGTANFGRCINAKKYYTLGMRSPCGQEDIEQLDDILYDKGFNMGGKSHGRNILDSWKKEYECLTLGGATFCISVEVFLECGYYEGARLDYISTVECYNNEGFLQCVYDLGGELGMEDMVSADLAQENLCGNRGLSIIQAPYMLRAIRTKWEEIQEEIEEVLQEVSIDTLRIIARFSNGEAIYEKMS